MVKGVDGVFFFGDWGEILFLRLLKGFGRVKSGRVCLVLSRMGRNCMIKRKIVNHLYHLSEITVKK